MRKQEYTSIEEIEAAYPDPGNETQKQRTTRLNTIRQAKSRLIKREQRRLAAGSSQVQTQQSQAGSSQIQTRSQTVANIVATQIQTRSRTATRDATPQPPTRSGTTAGDTLRRKRSRIELTAEQKEKINEKRRIRYATQKEQLRAQFLQIACCSIDNYVESVVEGNDIEENRHRLERMNQVCVHCNALKWKGETKKFCCREGEIVLAPLAPAPVNLHTLLTSNDDPSTNEPFVKKIRTYNSLFAFTSLGTTKIDQEFADDRGGAYTLGFMVACTMLLVV